MSIAAEIMTRLVADASQYQAEIGAAMGETESFAVSTDRMAAIGKVAWLGIGAAAVGAGVIGVKAAEDFEQAHARLVTAIHNSGDAWSQEKDHVENVESSMRKLGFTDTDTESSLARLTPVVGGVEQAMKLESLAADVAAGRHMSLQSATDLLVKVESGHVGLLGRMGLATKDATGATISQQQAIEELTSYYKGDAAAAADTFSGRLKVLEADADHVAVQFGEVLIPILEDLMGVGSGTIDFFERNHAAALGLAVVVGGPLVASMVAYVVKEAEIVGGKIAEFWLNVADAASAYAAQLTGTAAAASAAYEAEVAAELEMMAATMETNAAIEEQLTLLAEDGTVAATSATQLELFAAAQEEAAAATETTGAAVSTAGISFAAVVPVLGVAALAAYELGSALSDGENRFQESADAAKKWATDTENAASASGEGYDKLKDKLAGLKQHLADIKSQNDNIDWSSKQAVANAVYGQLGGHLETVGKDYEQTKDRIAELTPEVSKLEAEHRKELVTTTAVAQAYGVDLPSSYAKNSTDAKAMTKAIGEASDYFSASAISAQLAGGLTADSLQKTADDAKTFADSMQQSLTKATDPFAHFGDQAAVSETEMEQFFVGSQLKAAQWNGDIQKLIGEGVDKGIVQEMAKAGPDSLPAMDAFVQMVDQHGVAWVNSVTQSGQDAITATDAAFDQMTIDAGVKSQEMAAVVKAKFLDMQSGGTSHLQVLADSNDTEMAKIAQDTLNHLNAARAATDPPITPKVNMDPSLGDLGAVASAVRGLDGATATITLIAKKAGDAWDHLAW